MIEKNIQPWIAINQYMDDEYREHVISFALVYLPMASHELQKFAYQVIDQKVHIPGFRSIKRAPKSIALRHFIPVFKMDNNLVSATVALWAEAHGELIDEIRRKAEEVGLHFLPDWSLSEKNNGFIALEDFPELNKLVSQVVESLEKPDVDDYMLAAICLCQGLTPKAKPVESEPSADNQGIEMDDVQEHQNFIEKEENRLSLVKSESLPEYQGSLEEMDKELAAFFAGVESTRNSLIEYAEDLRTHVEKSNIVGAISSQRKASKELETWGERLEHAKELMESLNPRLLRERELRPDLHYDLLENFTEEPHQVSGSDQQIIEKNLSLYAEIVKLLVDYDQKREEKRIVLSRLQAELAELQDEIAQWEDGGDAAIDQFVDTSEMALSEIDGLVQVMLVAHQELKSQRKQLRELSIKRIGSLLEKLIELEIPVHESIIDELSIDQVKAENLLEWPSSRMKSLEQSLVMLVDQELSKSQSVETSQLAQSLQEGWNEDKLVSLLENLSRENRDVECLLTFLGANIIHPRQNTIELSNSVTGSLLGGFGQLARKSHPFQLINFLAPQFISGWETNDPKSQAELCVIFLAAHYSGEQRLPEGFLWNLPMEWPIPNMDNWSKLWEASLNNETIQFVDPDGESPADIFGLARQEATDMFAVDHGRYVRLSSVKSGRHRALLNNEIMPRLDSYLKKVKQIEDKAESADRNEMSQWINHLENLLSGELTQYLHEDSIEEMYEKGAHKNDIHDPDSFHRRTSLRTANESAESILRYALALKENLNYRFNSERCLTKDGLIKELGELPQISTLGQAALDQIIQRYQIQAHPWDEAESISKSKEWLEEELLNHSTYALRLPRIIAYLTGNPMNWEKLLEILLLDFSNPLDSNDTAAYLLEKEAPNHILNLAQYIPVELQKQAQTLKRKLEQEADGLQLELLQLEGNVADLQRDRELGRWQFFLKNLNERLSFVKADKEEKTQRAHAEAHQLRTRINNLDNQIFAIKDAIPTDAYQAVEKGLAVARRVCSQEENFSSVKGYLDEIQYRLDHQSWPVAELHDAFEELERRAAQETQITDDDLDVERVLNLFKEGEVGQLGLAENDIPAPSIGTRIDLLRNWLAVRSAGSIKFEDMLEKDRIAFHNFFRHFAKMTAMKRRLDPQGNPIISERPVISYMMDMSFPKTAVLDNRYIFLALPGNPPSSKDISNLEVLLDGKKWLDYFYVILFIPGCTPKIRDRLKSSYRKRGLVVVDAQTLLRMILAEQGSQNPIGRFRPIVLNALESDNVDVFKINQLVDARSSIFVGRDREVERIASSGDNYAIYGGRRIGKSSVLNAVENLLKHRGDIVISHSFEGQEDCSDDQSAVLLAERLGLDGTISGCGEFKTALQTYLEENPDSNLVILLDEIDRYIDANKDRHILIETLRSLSERFGHRFRIVISGFMHLYDCLNGRGPYTPASDPWGRMLNDTGPLKNLRPASAERIVREGFLDILGWNFESRAIPQRIVELTGGHPAFVQYFCGKVQERVGKRGDMLIKLEDVEKVFQDRDPDQSFIAYVRKTLVMNLDPIGRYLILWLTSETEEAKGFTFAQMLEYANLADIPISEDQLLPSIDRLKVTSVIKEVAADVFEFSVPDYPLILSRMGETAHMDSVEKDLERYLAKSDDA